MRLGQYLESEYPVMLYLKSVTDIVVVKYTAEYKSNEWKKWELIW